MAVTIAIVSIIALCAKHRITEEQFSKATKVVANVVIAPKPRQILP